MAGTAFGRGFAMAFFAFAIVAGLQLACDRGSLSPAQNVHDFRVYVCGERAILAHRDPYLTEPLRTCEHSISPEVGQGGAPPSWSATPFALPPYSAALLLPFGTIDFAHGRILWYGLIVVAFCLTATAVARTLGQSAFGVALVLTPTVGFLNLYFGETVPFAIAAAALAGLALERGRSRLAAILVTLSLLEPAIGLPAAVGLFFLDPKARTTLVVAAAVLGSIGVAAAGLARNIEYVTGFLPAHERAEFLASDQYGLSHLLYILGAPPHVASLAGTVCYVVAIAFGTIAARRLATQFRALIVLFPVATSMLGGPFVHDVEIAAAMPAAIVLARDSRLARVGVALLAVQWTQYWRFNVVPVSGTVVGEALLFLRLRPQRIAYAIVVTFVLIAINVGLPRPRPFRAADAVPSPAILATDFSSVPWGWEVSEDAGGGRGGFDRNDPLQKAPTWLALALVAFGSFAPKRFSTRGRSQSD